MASSSSAPPLWDVFLSFYGKDTRKNFISHLYFALDQAGVQTFRDDPALEKGEAISLGLRNAIKSSKKFVVVISENYAHSSWCLDELVEILGCKKTDFQVIPIFYHVDPSHLRHQKGSFGEALDYHKKRYSGDMIDKWKSALAAIAELSGYHLKKDSNENESDIIQEIVENVAPQVLAQVLHLEEYLFGIDSAVERISEKLSIESNDVRAIGICGMGGIGKTTTAKAFYNENSNKFDISCFVENIKESSQRGGPLLSLLEQVLIELLRRKDYKVRDVQSGIRILKQILCSKKALIVLDDLNHFSHSEPLATFYNLLSAGSRIVITTRDTNLLNQLKVHISKVEIYMVKVLGQEESLKLFSYHAFKETMPLEGFRELSIKFVTYAEGLPLALKVLGSSLRGRTDSLFWKDTLEKFQKFPEKNIQNILQLSYDELGDEPVKAIFLDIVFFFVGKDKNEANHIFKSCGFFPDAGIPILVERCLLTVDSDNRFQMHNLIQDMGREVGKNRHLHWKEDAWDDLQDLEGTDKIEGLILDLTLSSEKSISAEIFEKMPKLRLLQIQGAHNIKGSFGKSFRGLRCIRWHYCPWTCLPSSFRPLKLASLDMPFSKFKTLWNGAMPLVSLKTINVSYSVDLKATPDFGDAKAVEKLLFRGCKSLRNVHASIGQLSSLSHLDLFECDNLKALPDPIGQLSKLGYMNLRGCINLKRLPEPVKHLTNLGSLELAHCSNLRRLPEQLGDMNGLKKIDASYTAIEQLPDSVSRLRKLAELKLNNCRNLRKLPEQFGNMESLWTFDASYSAIQQLPDSFGGLNKLFTLNLHGCKKLEKLPDNFGDMRGLRTFDASFSAIEQLPDSITCISAMVWLKLYSCKKLRKLPDQLGNMEGLRMFDVSRSAIEQLPDSFTCLNELVELHLSRCMKLRKLPEHFGNMEGLRTLNACYSEFEQLPDSFARLINLGELELRLGQNFGNLPDSINNMKELAYIHLSCNIRLCMPIILNLSSVQSLYLTDEGESFSSEKPFSLSQLSNLKVLTLDKCTSLGSSFPELPRDLTELRVYEYATLQQLPDLSSLKQLKSLDIQRCSKLNSLSLLPTHLRQLQISDCRSLQNLPDLSMLKNLKDLHLFRIGSSLANRVNN
ncbi:disease resistance protein RPV1-like [Apium graveolens]|uniref:disease resistance protein RPV1-like n=1 Tax=Apium graveolens TaxID=4045 RepID=UPI003D7B0800